MDIQEQPTNHIPVHEASDSKAKMVFSVILVIVTFAAMAFAGLKWRSQILEYKTNINQRDQEISKLNKQLEVIDKQSTDATSDGTIIKTNATIEQDAEEIHKALLAVCNKKGGSGQYEYVTRNENGESVERVTPTILKLKNMSGDQQYVQEKGFAALNIGCRSVKSDGQSGAGFVSILQRNIDGSWGEILVTQEGLACSVLDKYRIPKEIQSTCDSSDGQGTPRANNN